MRARESLEKDSTTGAAPTHAHRCPGKLGKTGDRSAPGRMAVLPTPWSQPSDTQAGLLTSSTRRY